MFKCFATAALCLALTTPLQAQMLDGADDPRFQAALTTLLSANDPAAVKTLHDLAEAGNPAALVLLPFALEWVPLQGNLKEKNALRMIGGVRAQEVAAEAHGATALWNIGQFETSVDLPDRAAGLIARGEREKAAFLFFKWINQTGARGDLPPQLFSDEVPAVIGGLALQTRLIQVFTLDGAAPEEAAPLLTLLNQDHLAGWLAYVTLTDSYPEIFDIIGNPVVGTGLSASQIEDRIQNARAVYAAWLGYTRDDPPMSRETAARALKVLTGRVELLPIANLCQAHCTDSIASCETAALAYPGLASGIFETVQPFADVLDPLAFAASDRGVAAMIPPPPGWPATAKARAAAEEMDSCYADLLAYRDQLVFGP